MSDVHKWWGGDENLLDIVAARLEVETPALKNTEARIRAVGAAAGIDLTPYACSDLNLIEKLRRGDGGDGGEGGNGGDDKCPAGLIYRASVEPWMDPWDEWQADPPRVTYAPRSTDRQGTYSGLVPVGHEIGCHALDVSVPVLLEAVFTVPTGGNYLPEYEGSENSSVGVDLTLQRMGEDGAVPAKYLVRAQWLDGGPKIVVDGQVVTAVEPGASVHVGICLDVMQGRHGLSVNGGEWRWFRGWKHPFDDIFRTDYENIELPFVAFTAQQAGASSVTGVFTCLLRTSADEFTGTFPMAGRDLQGNEA